MPAFSKKSIETLGMCHDDLITVFSLVGKLYNCTIVESYRNKARQEKLFKEGLSKVHYPSYHNCNPSFAVDVAPYEMTKIDWDLKQCIQFNGYVTGLADFLFHEKMITHKLFSGLDWDGDHDINDTTFMDVTHFFIKPIPPEKMNFVEILT